MKEVEEERNVNILYRKIFTLKEDLTLNLKVSFHQITGKIGTKKKQR